MEVTAEVTMEVTAEVTAEVTMEVTAEVTAEVKRLVAVITGNKCRTCRNDIARQAEKQASEIPSFRKG